MSSPAITRIDPAMRLERWPDMPAHEVASGSGTQWGALVFEDKAIGLSVGVWAAEPVECTWFDYPVDEFMVVLEGEISIDTAEGEIRIGPGESFLIAKGTHCRWRHAGPVRKIFFIVDQPGVAGGANRQVRKLDPGTTLLPSPPPSADLLLSPTPVQVAAEAHAGAGGRWTVGVWQTAPYHRKRIPFPRHELMVILDGAVTLTDDQGRRERIAAGESVFVPFGAPCDWRNEIDVKKIYCIYQPDPA